MRLFIYEITYRWNENQPPRYDFTASAESSWSWKTKEQANSARRLIEQDGIAIMSPLGPTLYCEDYRIEARPQGGFSISCVHPLAST
jgi:hypothetical protein